MNTNSIAAADRFNPIIKPRMQKEATVRAAVPYLVSLFDSDGGQLSLVGGKFQNLAKLTAWGLPVPEAFCLTTETYRAFVEANSLAKVVGSLRGDASRPSDPAAHRRTLEAVRGAFLAGTIPQELSSQIEQMYRQVSASALAVRSSATFEDSSNASVAGGHETILNVHSLESLYKAIRECWASLWTERAILYRRRFQIKDEDVALAIVVQRMLSPVVSGVSFTVDPVSGDNQRVVVEACWGLGELLVSGGVTPDHYEVQRRDSAIQCRRRGNQTKMIVGLEGGETNEVSLPDSLRARPCLDEGQVQSIAAISILIENHFGQPQDIEWAIENETSAGEEKLYLLQTRPITTLKKQQLDQKTPTVPWENPIPGAIWVRAGGGMIEYMPGPLSPLYVTAQLPDLCRLHDLQPSQMGIELESPSYALINGHYYCRHDYKIKLSGILFPLLYWRIARTKPRWWREKALPTHLSRLNELSSLDVYKASNDDLLDHLRALIEFNAVSWDSAVWGSRASIFTEPLFHGIFRMVIRPITGGDAIVFLRGFESKTLEGEKVRWRLVESALSHPEISECIQQNEPEEALKQLAGLSVAQDWLRGFQDYCSTYGHITGCHDYMQPTMADDPERAMLVIQNSLELPSTDPGERQRRLADERERATSRAMAMLSRKPIRKALFRWILAWAQEAGSIRENVFFYALQGWPIARRTICEMGRRLTKEGLISSPEDIFFLTWDEAQQALSKGVVKDWRVAIAERQDRFKSQTQIAPPFWVPEGGPPLTIQRKIKLKVKRIVFGRKKTKEGTLRGVAVSPGVVTGPARIIRSTADFDLLRAGEILVAPTATPDWIPTFAVAAALVTESGGPLSHSSIIVREFGIPAVMGAENATNLIADGQVITIDGGQGLIQIH